jgi:hypothetical protein
MRSKNWYRFAIVSCVVLVAVLLAAPARAQGNCTALGGTIAAHFEFAGSQGPGWYGRAYLTFGKDPTVLNAALVDLNNGYKEHPIRNLAGDEILTFTVEGVGSFQMAGHFLCAVGSTPYLCGGFSEEGKVIPEAGTGQFAGMTGNISIHGSAVADVFPIEDNPWLWIAQMTGSVCNAQ